MDNTDPSSDRPPPSPVAGGIPVHRLSSDDIWRSSLQDLIAVLDSPQPDEVHDMFPFSTSSKGAIGRISPGRGFDELDEIELVLYMQSLAPWELTPELLIEVSELRKEWSMNWQSAEGGEVLKHITGSLKVVQQESRYREEFQQDKGKGFTKFFKR